MKSPLNSSVAAVPTRNTRFLRGAIGGSVLCLLGAASAMGQGQYYPVNPSGSNGPWVGGLPQYGGNPSTYSAIQVYASPSLVYLTSVLQNTYGTQYTLQVPVPGGQQAPTTQQYATAVALAVNGVLSGSAPSLNNGTSLTDLQLLANEAVAWNATNFSSITTAIAQTVVQYDSSTAVANLKLVTSALANSQPSILPNIVASIVTQAGTNNTVAQGIPQIVASALAAVPNNATAINLIVNNGVAYGIASSSLTAAGKSTLFSQQNSNGYIFSLINAATTPAQIDAITQAVSFTNFTSISSLTAILDAAVAGLASNNTTTMGALTDGALRSQGGANASSVASILAAASGGTASYTNAVVQGYSNSGTAATFKTQVLANPTLADALAQGAVTKGTLAPASILTEALTDGTAVPANIIAAAVGANQSSAMTTLVGAINTTTHTPYGSATFGDVAYGGAQAAPLASAGNTTQVVLLNSSTGVTALSTPTVTQVVTSALNGANAGGNQAAFAALIYNTQYEAKYTSPGTASNPGIAAVQAAVDTLNTINNPNYPAYLAPVAAVAGDTYGYNQTNVATAGNNELTSKGLSAQVTAATAGENVVSGIRANSATTYTVTINAYKNALVNADPTNSAKAILYGAILINPTEYAAELASAIKQSSVSDTTLTQIANNGLLPSNGVNLTSNTQMVDQVATHFKNEATGSGIADAFGYVSHQIVVNNSLTTQIVAAATVIDPDSAHFFAHAAAFQNPTNVYLAIPSIFAYTQITNPNPIAAPTPSNPNGVLLPSKSAPGSTPGVVVDQPAVAALLTASLVDGIMEANTSAATTQTNLVNAVRQAVLSAVAQNGTNLQGPLHPFTGDSVNIFQQSDGTVAGTVSNYRTVGPAGAITGFVAQMVQSGDTTISSVTAAVLTAASAGNVRAYGLAIAQAAAQALRWVGGTSVSGALAGPMVAGNPAYDIAFAMSTSVSGFFTMTQLENAAAFGITQAANGVIGAGALGLNANGINPGTGPFSVAATGNSNSAFYLQHSATGTPVTDVFNL